MQSNSTEKRFITIKELADYTGWGLTKTREVVKRENSGFTLRVGNKYFIDKNKFDKYIENCIRYNISI